MNSEQARKTLKVGVVVSIAIVTLGFAILTIGARQNLFSSKMTYYAKFGQIQGLMTGAPVRLVGVPVGTVDAISFPDDPSDDRILVTIKLDEAVKNRMWSDTEARIRSMGPLGDKYLELRWRRETHTDLLPPGSDIRTYEPPEYDQMLAGGQDIVENLNEITQFIRRMTDRLDQGEGVLGRLLKEPDFGQQLLENIEGSVQRTNTLLARLEAGQTLLGRVMADEAYGRKTSADIEQTLTDLKEIVHNVREGKGVVGQLIADQELADSLLDSLREVSGNLSTLSDQLSNQEGLLPTLLSDSEFRNRITTDLETITGNLAVISEKLAQGKGTLGQLIDDPSIYEGMQDVVTGVNDSKFLKWYIRKKQKKGARLRPTPAEPPAEEPTS